MHTDRHSYACVKIQRHKTKCQDKKDSQATNTGDLCLWKCYWTQLYWWPLPIGVLATAMFVHRWKRDNLMHTYIHTSTHRCMNRIYSIINICMQHRTRMECECMWQYISFYIRAPDVLFVCMSAFCVHCKRHYDEKPTNSMQYFIFRLLKQQQQKFLVSRNIHIDFGLWDAKICYLVYALKSTADEVTC